MPIWGELGIPWISRETGYFTGLTDSCCLINRQEVIKNNAQKPDGVIKLMAIGISQAAGIIEKDKFFS